MTSIDPYAALNGAASTRSDPAARNQLGQNEFLELMIAQLRNQDPLKPADPTEFVSQLAQFGTVTGIQNMESSLGELASSLRSAQVLNGANLVGREVLAESEIATLAAGGTVRGAADVPEAATSVQVVVHDAAGQVVRRFSLVPQPGLVEFTWDGLTDTGAAAPAGEYGFEVIASAGSESASLQPLVASRVSSVTVDPASHDLILNTAAGAMRLTDVRRVL